MTYTFPPSLTPLKEYLRGLGADTLAFASARQAAFMAQQLLGTRVKFPPAGADMTPTLFLIQKAVTEKGIRLDAPALSQQSTKAKGRQGKAKGDKIPPFAKSSKQHNDFGPEAFATGIHIFCDGAAVPNPGTGGWGVVVYRDGVEIDSVHGGDPEATNNQMELTAILNAIEKAKALWPNSGRKSVTIWCDSQYCVKGCNEWMAGWKAKGWQRGSDKAEPKNRILLNADLWRAIDAALEDALKLQDISIKWVKGHNDIAGNERADELAEMGRQEAEERSAAVVDHLTSAYNQTMAE